MAIDPTADDLGGPYDVIFECVGKPGLLDVAAGAVATHGRVVIAGVCARARHLSCRSSRCSRGCRSPSPSYYRSDEFRTVVEAFASGRIDPAPLITRTVGLADLDTTFESLVTAPEDVKVYTTSCRSSPAMADYETLVVRKDNGVAWVTLNRPNVHNAFNIQMRNELKDCWRSLRYDDEVRCVVLTGAGERAFCTGIDRMETMGDGYPADGAAKKGRDRLREVAVDVRRPRRRDRPEVVRPVEAGDRRGERHRVRRRVLHARRGRVHHRGRARRRSSTPTSPTA